MLKTRLNESDVDQEAVSGPVKSMMPGKRFYYLDLMRGIAATAVLFDHYRFFYMMGVTLPNDWSVGRQPFSKVFSTLYGAGGLAVTFFWMLSGFVFMSTYGVVGKDISARSFWLARFARLYPLHFATLLLVAVVQQLSFHLFGYYQIYQYNDWYHFILQLFMASRWGFEAGHSFNGPIWSVSVEILIYGVFFIYMRIAKASLASLCLMIMVFLVIRFLGVANIANCGMCFFFGALTYLLVQRLGQRPLKHAATMLICGVVVSYVMISRIELVPRLLEYVLTFSSMAILLWTTVLCDLSFAQVPKQLRWIGEITYSTYLIHAPLIIVSLIVFRAVDASVYVADNPLVLILFISTTWIMGYLIHRQFELPMQEYFRNRWGKSR